MADLKTTNIFGDAYINNKVGIATNAPATRLQIGQLLPTSATEGIQFGDDTSTRIYRSSPGTLTLNGVVAGLSLSASTALYGNYGDWSGESNKIQWHSNNLYFVNRGGGSWIFRNSSAANVVDIASNGTTTIAGNISAANLSGTNTGDQTIGNGTITIAAGTGIGVGTSNTFTMNQSGATTVTVTNSGVTSNVAGTGISVSGATGAVTITNSGVTSAVAGTGISVSGATGAVTISVANGVYTNGNNTFTGTNVQNSPNNTFVNTVTNANQSLTFYQATSGADAYMTFHIGSDFAGYFGLGGAENDLVWGGWSVGNYRYRILHSGNASYAWNMNQNVRTTDSPTFSGLSLTSVSTTGATITNLTGAYQNTSVYDSAKTQSATPSRGIRAPASSIQFTDSYAIAPFYTYRSTGDWPVPYGIGWGTGGESSGIFQRYASNGSSFGDMIFYTGNDGYGAFSFRRHTWEGTAQLAAGSGELSTELFRVDWSGNLTMLGTLNGSANSATLYANGSSYGSWKIGGTRNGWYGIEFESGTNLMANSSEVGFHRNGYGWQMRWYAGTGYVSKGNPGGGTEATILDSSNQAYAWAMNQYVRTTDSPTFAVLQLTRLNFGATGAAPYNAASGEGYGNGITFGGDENSAAYRIFTGMENIGGNYSKLTLNWHTGIRIGAYYGYGGIRFYNNYVGTGTKVFSIAEGDDNVRVANELFVGTDGIGAYKFMKYGGTRSGDWQLFTTSSVGAGQMNVVQVNNITGGSHTNYPSGVYGYGGVMSWRLSNHSFQLYAAHTGDLAYKTQWDNDNYSGWRRILDSSSYPYAANMNQYVRTTDSPTFAAVSATTFTGALTGTASGNLTAASTLTAGNLSGTIPSGVLGNSTLYVGTTAITLNRTSSALSLTGISIDGNAATATTLQTARAINGVSFNGSAAITVDGLNYSVNNAWLRENGDDAQFQMYGNSRTMIYRTDGNTNPHGGGGYAHIFYYGGSADAQRMFIINTDGRLWSNYHGWLDAMSISGNAATATSATSATTATTATNATVNSGNTSASWYPIVWHSGNTLYSTAGVTLYAGGSYIQTAYFNSSDDVSTGNISHIVAKFGDNYHRSATAAKVAAFITGQTMNINGSSTSCSGNAATCTTANAVAAGAIKAAGLDSSVEFTMTGLTSNSTIKIFPSYVSPYSSFLRMGYDNTGNYEYTIKRDGTTGFLEFYNTQANYTGYYFRINGSGGGLGIAVSPASRLHVNGDGTNPAVRVDNTGVVLAASVGSNGRTFYGWLPISVDGTTRWIRIFS